MANITKYGDVGSISTRMSTELNTLANGSRAQAGSDYNNATNLNMYGAYELVISSTSNMTANATVSLFLIPKIDGTNLIEGTSANAPDPGWWYGDFVIPRASNSFRLGLIPGINAPLKQLPPFAFRELIQNNSGQAFLSANTLKLIPFNLQNNA